MRKCTVVKRVLERDWMSMNNVYYEIREIYCHLIRNNENWTLLKCLQTNSQSFKAFLCMFLVLAAVCYSLLEQSLEQKLLFIWKLKSLFPKPKCRKLRQSIPDFSLSPNDEGSNSSVVTNAAGFADMLQVEKIFCVNSKILRLPYAFQNKNLNWHFWYKFFFKFLLICKLSQIFLLAPAFTPQQKTAGLLQRIEAF